MFEAWLWVGFFLCYICTFSCIGAVTSLIKGESRCPISSCRHALVLLKSASQHGWTSTLSTGPFSIFAFLFKARGFSCDRPWGFNYFALLNIITGQTMMCFLRLLGDSFICNTEGSIRFIKHDMTSGFLVCCMFQSDRIFILTSILLNTVLGFVCSRCIYCSIHKTNNDKNHNTETILIINHAFVLFFVSEKSFAPFKTCCQHSQHTLGRRFLSQRRHLRANPWQVCWLWQPRFGQGQHEMIWNHFCYQICSLWSAFGSSASLENFFPWLDRQKLWGYHRSFQKRRCGLWWVTSV